MNTNQTLNKVRTLLGIEVKLEQMKLDNGAILEAEVFEAGAEIFVVADEERVAVPVGEYETEEGMVIVIEEEGVISEIKEAEAKEEEAPQQEEEEVEVEAKEEEKEEMGYATKEELAEVKAMIEDIKAMLEPKEEMSAEPKEEVKEELSSDKVELSEEVEGISHNPEKATSKKELNLYSQKGKNNTLNTIFNKLNK